MKKVATKKSAENIFFALFSISHFLKKVKSRFFPLFSIFHFFKKWKIKKSAKKIFSADFFVATFFITAKPYLLFYGFFIMSICHFSVKVRHKIFDEQSQKNGSIEYFSIVIFNFPKSSTPQIKRQNLWELLLINKFL